MALKVRNNIIILSESYGSQQAVHENVLKTNLFCTIKNKQESALELDRLKLHEDASKSRKFLGLTAVKGLTARRGIKFYGQ